MGLELLTSLLTSGAHSPGFAASTQVGSMGIASFLVLPPLFMTQFQVLKSVLEI